jgi:hypothetical protein
MLETLNDVRWHRLRHARGPAIDTPTHLLNLLSSDAETRADACCRLEDTINHQGNIYSATVAAVPFLIEIAGAPETPAPEDALELLTSIAQPVTGEMVHPDLREILKPFLGLPRFHGAIQPRIRSGIDVYLRLLRTGTEAVRRQIAELLTCLPDEREQSIPALCAALRDAREPATRATLILALGWLGVKELQPGWLRGAFDAEADPLARVLLARELLLAETTASFPGARRLVRDAIMAGDGELSTDYDDLPLGGDLVADLALALAVADPAMGRDLLPQLIRAANVAPFMSDQRAIAILLLAREKGADPFPSGRITSLTRDGIEAIARKTFQPGSYPGTVQGWRCDGSKQEILRCFGLPDSPEGLRKLCGIPEPSEQR